MTPGADRMLQILSQALLTHLAPGLAEDYEKRNALLVAMLLGAAAEQWDGAAAWRAEENAALRRLFADATPLVEEAALAGRLREAAGATDPSLRVSDLERTNAALRGLLVALHAHVETLDSAPARELEARIWTELRRSTERRRLAIQPF